MKDPKKILEDLLEAVSTEDVKGVLEKHKFSDNDWKPYGGREKNWDIVSNQQTNAISALTEIVTNSIDAVLSKKAYEHGLTDLSSDDAPDSMREAVNKFFKVKEGKLSFLEPRQLTKLAEKAILIGIKRKKGGNTMPTITVVDHGEGQNPEDFEKTFLSLGETNKEGIRFVQGKFNMGSTGSIRFCTESDIKKKHYKLIASKRHDGDLWGWTILRVREVQEGQKLPVVEYWAPGNKIPSFAAEKIKVFREEDIGIIGSGSLVRLYDYDIGNSAYQVDFGLYRALALSLLYSALPVRIYDFDAKKLPDKGELRERGIAARTFGGMSVILGENLRDPSTGNPDISEEKPENPTTEFVHLLKDCVDPDLGAIRFIATGVSQLPNFMTSGNKKRIFYTINGQSHATANASFFNRSGVKLGDLQNHLIVEVQCENMDKTAMNTIFMGNRENMADNPSSRKLLEILEKSLAEDSKLKEYQNIIKKRRARQIIEENEETKRMLSDILTKDPAIRELLGLGGSIPTTAQIYGGYRPYTDGKKFPTFLRPLNVKFVEGRYEKDLPLGSYRKIKCGTDAANDYLTRGNSPGWIVCDPNYVARSASLRNGTAVFTFESLENTKVGDTFTFSIGFDDYGPRGKALTFPLTLRMIAPEKTQTKPPGKPTKTKSREKEQITDPTRWVSKEEWSEYSFDEKSGATVTEGSEGLIVWVNRANESLEKMRANEMSPGDRELNESRFKFCLGFLTLAIYRFRKKDAKEEEATHDAENASSAMAPYVLSLIKTLGGS